MPFYQDLDVEVAATTEIRARTYELLARGYLQEPTAIYIEELAKMVKLLQDDLYIPEGLTVTVNIDMGEIKQEFYDRFFVNVSAKYVPPFESAIVERELNGNRIRFGPLNGPLTLHVRDCYQVSRFDPWKLDIFKPLQEIPIADYLGFELAFMAYLSFAELEAYKTNRLQQGLQWRQWQQRFLEQHLGRWINDYALLACQTAGGFFGEIAKISSAWVDADYQNNFQS
ncbi:Nitrate reductase delta subunit [Neomoorella glycerini]|uniref:Nitrate reductase delta subunit n=1 Tax=Neomoorella glycerini TaxID=55779 RepID=A0A6I5ZWD6_9FIRM|nr:molecular chaperone TorD family protein [Moorella glycerini]QGP94019.1 Nitrate reductase delta subunit [Moorella glycerini]